MQCNCCLLDFKRNSIGQIVDRLNYIGDAIAKAFFQQLKE